MSVTVHGGQGLLFLWAHTILPHGSQKLLIPDLLSLSGDL